MSAGRPVSAWLAFGAVALLMALALAGCGNMRPGAQDQATPEPGEIVTAFVGSLASESSASGQLRPQQDVSLALGTGGQVAETFVQGGDVVQEGDQVSIAETKEELRFGPPGHN